MSVHRFDDHILTDDNGARHSTDCSNAVGSSDHGLFRGCRQRPIHGERIRKIRTRAIWLLSNYSGCRVRGLAY